ncbi:MAG: hypothetical protein HQL73_02310 [Magnetococcales bacterium]|nr:hypothetical protein [Magnetococcales bacterium]
MKTKRYISGRRAVASCVVLAAATWIVAPPSEAFGTGAWTYPENSSARMRNIQELSGLLNKLSVAHIQQQQRMQTAQKTLAGLEAQLAAAQRSLMVEEGSAAELMNKYRKAQELSLIDPMLSTETQRRAVVKAKKAHEARNSKNRKKIETLSGKILQVRTEIESASQAVNSILQQIDRAVRERDEVSEMVFLKTVAN